MFELLYIEYREYIVGYLIFMVSLIFMSVNGTAARFWLFFPWEKRPIETVSPMEGIIRWIFGPILASVMWINLAWLLFGDIVIMNCVHILRLFTLEKKLLKIFENNVKNICTKD